MHSSSRSQTPVNDVTTTHNGDNHGYKKYSEDVQSNPDTDDARSDASGLGRSGTLRKKSSIVRKSSLNRSSSRRRSLGDPGGANNPRSVFFSPVPTHGNPTDILTDRFSGWRRILKDFIAYFKEVSSSYEVKAKTSGKLFQSLSGAIQPEMFLKNGGILETDTVLKDYHRAAMLAYESAHQINAEIISTLAGLRNDLSVKIKEIKGLSGDFKNSLEKEREATRKSVTQLTEALGTVDGNTGATTGKSDPYIVKLAVERQLRKQLNEENYLHRAYLNLEGSGRELESIVVTEIQKAFELYVRILKREGSEITDAAERLETQTLGLPRDHEWTSFVEKDPNFVNPKIGIRRFEDLEYPGYNNPAVIEVRAGMMERKSKYLKSYTPGWYALSPSHLHEFKTQDRAHDLTPVMSLYLRDSEIGSHTGPSSSSHKFMVKGRQTGAMHRGHSWVFRAETHEAMMGFYDDIKKLTDLSGAERNAFITSHARTPSGGYHESHSSGSEGGLDHDEADEIPYSAPPAQPNMQPRPSLQNVRPEGGRFPSDIDVNRRHTAKSVGSDSERSAGIEDTSTYTVTQQGNAHSHQHHNQAQHLSTHNNGHVFDVNHDRANNDPRLLIQASEKGQIPEKPHDYLGNSVLNTTNIRPNDHHTLSNTNAVGVIAAVVPMQAPEIGRLHLRDISTRHNNDRGTSQIDSSTIGLTNIPQREYSHTHQAPRTSIVFPLSHDDNLSHNNHMMTTRTDTQFQDKRLPGGSRPTNLS